MPNTLRAFLQYGTYKSPPDYRWWPYFTDMTAYAGWREVSLPAAMTGITDDMLEKKHLKWFFAQWHGECTRAPDLAYTV